MILPLIWSLDIDPFICLMVHLRLCRPCNLCASTSCELQPSKLLWPKLQSLLFAHTWGGHHVRKYVFKCIHQHLCWSFFFDSWTSARFMTLRFLRALFPPWFVIIYQSLGSLAAFGCLLEGWFGSNLTFPRDSPWGQKHRWKAFVDTIITFSTYINLQSTGYKFRSFFGGSRNSF